MKRNTTLIFSGLFGIALAGSNDFLAPFWGSDLSPTQAESTRFTLQIDQFTELNNDSIPFPFKEKQADCGLYCETIGFNQVSISKTRAFKRSSTITLGAFAGIANDAFSEYLQNDYSHARNHIAPVPRDGVSTGKLFGLSAEVNSTAKEFSKLFYGSGMLLNNTYAEVYLHSGLWRDRLGIYENHFGIIYSLTTRCGLISPIRENVFSGKYYFPRLSFYNSTSQLEGGVFVSLWKIPLEFSWRGNFSTGVFLNEHTDKVVPMFTEGLRTRIWKFSFERYNDALNGTDYGPTYGIKMNFTL
jgi:hypothetical protein